MRTQRAVLILLSVAVGAVGQTVIVNTEDTVFYYVTGMVDESALDGAAVLSVPPRGFRLVADAKAGVTGYFFVPGRTTHPGLRVALGADTGPVDLAIPDRAAFLVEALVPPDTGAPVRLDNRYLDWSRIPVLSRYTRHHEPREVVRVTESSRTTVASRDSLFFGRGGSDLEMLRALRVGGELYLMIASFSGLSPGFSLFLHGYGGGEARYTLEVAITDELPTVFLWRADSQEPLVVGTFARSTFFLEAVVWADRLPRDAGFLEQVEFFEVSTAIADAGIVERFPYGRIRVSEIPAADG